MYIYIPATPPAKQKIIMKIQVRIRTVTDCELTEVIAM